MKKILFLLFFITFNVYPSQEKIETLEKSVVKKKKSFSDYFYNALRSPENENSKILRKTFITSNPFFGKKYLIGRRRYYRKADKSIDAFESICKDYKEEYKKDSVNCKQEYLKKVINKVREDEGRKKIVKWRDYTASKGVSLPAIIGITACQMSVDIFIVLLSSLCGGVVRYKKLSEPIPTFPCFGGIYFARRDHKYFKTAFDNEEEEFFIPVSINPIHSLDFSEESIPETDTI